MQGHVLFRFDGFALLPVEGQAQRRFDRAANGDEKPVAGGVDHAKVKGECSLGANPQRQTIRIGRGKFVAMPTDGGMVLRRAITRGKIGRAGLEAQAHFEDVFQDLAIELGRDAPSQHVAVEKIPVLKRQYARSDPRRDVDKTLGDESLDRFPDDSATGTVDIAKITFDR